jgi:dihydroorotate dehydrogenase (fumarate)
MPDLSTRYLGLELRSPLVASASPLTGRIETLERLENAGAAAVVLPSLFEEELVGDSIEVDRTLELGAEQFGEAVSYFPDMDFYDLGPERHVRLVEQAKSTLEIPVIASVNASRPGSWSRYAGYMAEAGADAIELNLYAVHADPARSGVDVERDYLDAIREVREAVNIPVAVKLSPFFSSTAHFAVQAASAGVDGLVLFNRFYQPDIDLETLDVLPTVELSRPLELRLPLRWIAILRGHLPGISLAATSGVHTGEDVAKALLVGADAVMMTSALLRHGPEFIELVEMELRRFVADNDYASVEQLRGSVSGSSAADPAAFERANYIRVLSSYRLPGSVGRHERSE